MTNFFLFEDYQSALGHYNNLYKIICKEKFILVHSPLSVNTPVVWVRGKAAHDCGSAWQNKLSYRTKEERRNGIDWGPTVPFKDISPVTQALPSKDSTTLQQCHAENHLWWIFSICTIAVTQIRFQKECSTVLCDDHSTLVLVSSQKYQHILALQYKEDLVVQNWDKKKSGVFYRFFLQLSSCIISPSNILST